jgi:hypothetical protein
MCLEVRAELFLVQRVRRMNPSLSWFCWALICLATAGVGMAVEPGMARVNVLQELGRPISAVARGNTEVLTYKDGVKITLKDGKVTEIAGQPPVTTAPAEAAAEASAPTPAAEPPEPPEPLMTKAEQAEQARLEKKYEEEAAKARAEMEKALNDLENRHHEPVVHEKPAFDIVGFLIGLVLKWLLTLAALKLTCKYWGCEVFWSGLMTVAAVDVGVRAVVGLVGLLVLQMESLFYADEAIAAIVMVLVLRKVSINQSLAQAVQITMTTKVFSVVVGSFLFVVMINLLN